MRLILVLLMACGLAGCAGNPKADLPVNPVSMPAPDGDSQIYVDNNYRLSPFDELTITVFRVSDLSGKYKIDPSGNLNMPLIGPVDVAGMSVASLKNQLERLYGTDYLQSPDITVQIDKSQSQNLTIEGAVKNPGIYTIEGRTTLIGAVAIAKGLDLNTANAKRVVVFRKIGGEKYAAAFNLKEIRAGLTADPDIYGGDIVVVDGSNLRQTYLDIIRTVPLLAFFTRL